MNKRIKCLMVGPGPGEKGGISAVIATYLEIGFKDNIEVKYITTYKDGSKPYKIFIFLRSLCNVLLCMRWADIVHIHMAAGASFFRKAIIVKIAYIFNKKIIIHQHGGAFDQFYEKAGKNRRKIIRTVFSYADRVILLSKEWKDFFVKEICDEEKTTVIFNGVVIPDFKRNNYLDKNILFIGRIDEKKGIYDLLDAFSKALQTDNEIHLYIAGTGEGKRLIECVKRLNIEDKIELLGWIRGKEKDEIMKKCSLMILPSYTEGMPVSVLEAMSYNMCTIASDVGGIPQIIDDKVNGMLIKPGHPEMIEQKINLIISKPAEKMRIGQNARAKICKMFDAKIGRNRIEQLYFEMIR